MSHFLDSIESIASNLQRRRTFVIYHSLKHCLFPYRDKEPGGAGGAGEGRGEKKVVRAVRRREVEFPEVHPSPVFLSGNEVRLITAVFVNVSAGSFYGRFDGPAGRRRRRRRASREGNSADASCTGMQLMSARDG